MNRFDEPLKAQVIYSFQDYRLLRNPTLSGKDPIENPVEWGNIPEKDRIDKLSFGLQSSYEPSTKSIKISVSNASFEGKVSVVAIGVIKR